MSDPATPWTAAYQAFLSFTIFWSLLKLMCIESVVLSNHLILCCPLLLPSIFPSTRVFSNELDTTARNFTRDSVYVNATLHLPQCAYIFKCKLCSFLIESSFQHSHIYKSKFPCKSHFKFHICHKTVSSMISLKLYPLLLFLTHCCIFNTFGKMLCP